MKKLIFTILAAILVATNANAGEDFPRRGKTFFDVWKASCRVEVPGARGSGLYVGDDDEGRSNVFTNYHVVQNATTCVLQFRTNGEPVDVSGRVYARYYDANLPADFALIEADRAALERLGVPYIPLAGAGVYPTENSYIISSGAPKGRFVQAWKGKILGYYNGSTALFEPGPVPGQSGSAIVSEIDGELWVTGILTWLIGQEGADDARGGAIPISKLYEAAKGTRTSVPNFSPIPPGAKECAETDAELLEIAAKAKAPFVLEFTRDDCLPCKDAEKDVQEIREAGFSLWSFNVSETEDAERRGRALRVVAYPTFIVFSSEGKELERFIGSGRARKIIERLKRAKEDEEKELATESEPTAPLRDTDDAAKLSLELSNDEDFRTRSPVESVDDVSFLDKSEKIWKNRRTPPESDEEPAPRSPLIPKRNDDASGNFNGLLGSVEKRLSATFSTLFDEKIARLRNEAETRLNAFTRAIKRAAFAFGLFGVLAAVLLLKTLSGVWSGCKWIIKKIIDREARKLATASEKLKKLAETLGDPLADIDAGLDEIEK